MLAACASVPIYALCLPTCLLIAYRVNMLVADGAIH